MSSQSPAVFWWSSYLPFAPGVSVDRIEVIVVVAVVFIEKTACVPSNDTSAPLKSAVGKCAVRFVIVPSGRAGDRRLRLPPGS